MKNKKISANEINKFCYCNYQWYYGKIYGNDVIREKNSEYIKTKGSKLIDTDNNFKRGLDFHNNYLSNFKRQQKIKLISRLIIFISIIVIAAILFFTLTYFNILDLGAVI